MTMSVSAITSVAQPYAPAASASAVSVSTALASMATTRSGTLLIADTADNIARNLDALQASRAKIATITISDGNPLTISAKQLQADADALGKIGSYSLAVTGATAADVKTLAANAKVATIAVKDSVANIGANLDLLQANAAKLSEIRQTGVAKAIDISAAQLSSASAALGKIADTYSLNVRGVSIANLASVAADAHVRGIGIVDTSDHIASNLDLLQSYGVKLLSAESSDKTALNVTAEQVRADALTLGKIYGGYQLNVRGATLADIAALGRNAKVKSIEVQDTAENVARNLEALKRLGTHLSSITITNTDSALAMSATQYGSYAEVLKKISSAGVHYSLSNASVAGATALAGDSAVTSIAVADTSANLSSGLATLTALDTRLAGITRTGSAAPLALTASQLETHGATLAKIGNAYSLAVSGVTAENAATLAAMDKVSAIHVADSSTNIAAQWDSLNATPVLAKLKQLTQTGTAAPLALSAAQISRGSALLGKIAGTVQLAASAVSAASAIALAKDARVTSLNVVDTSDNLSKYFDSLDGLGAKVATLTSSDNNALAITASQLRTKTGALGKISGDYTLAVRLAFASDAATIADNTHVSTIAVADTAANLSANLDTLTGLGDKVAKIDVLGKAPISIAADKLDANADSLAKIATAYSLSVTKLAAADAKAMAARDRVVGVSVSDTSANIAANLADLNAIGSELGSITQSTVETMEIGVADLLANGKVLAKISNGYSLAVSDVSVKQASYVATLRNVIEMNLVDSGNAISTNFNKLVSLNPLIGAIAQSDAGSALNLTATQRLAGAALLEKIADGDYTLSISDARASEVATLAADEHVTTLQVVDTASGLVQNLAALKSAMAVASGSDTLDKLAGIRQSGSGNLAMTAAQLADYDSVLGRIKSPYKLDIGAAAAADATALATRTDIATLSVSDGSAAIASNLDALQALGKKLKSITQSGTAAALSLTASQLSSDAAALAKISNRYTLAVHDVSAEAAARVAANVNVATMDVVDSSANIASRLDSLQKAATKIASITQSGTPAALQITNAQRNADADALAKLDAYTLALRNVAAADAGALQSDALVTSFIVSDSSENIARHFDALVAAGDQLTAIAQSGTAAPIALTLQQYTDNAATLSKIANNYNVAVRDVTAQSAAAVAAHANVATVAIKDTVAAVTAQLDALHALGSKLKAISLSDSDSAMQLSAAQYASSRSTLARIAGAYSLAVSEAGAEDAIRIAADPAVVNIQVADSSDNVSANFDKLAALGTELESITLDDTTEPVSITIGQFTNSTQLLQKIAGDYQLDISGVSAEKASAVAAQDHVSSVSVSDSVENLLATLPAMQALDTELKSVTLSNNLTPLSLSAAQWSAAAGVLDKITNGFRATVSGVAADSAATIAGDAHVTSVQVSDSGDGVSQNLAGLQALGNKLSGIALAGGSTIALSATQLKESASLIAKISTGYTLAVSDVAAASASAIGTRNDVGSFAVSDSADNLARYWNVLQPLAGKISEIAQTDDAPIAISATQYAQSGSLTAKLGNSYALTVANANAASASAIAADSHVVSLSVVDTALNLSDDPSNASDFLPALIDISDKLSAITVSDGGKLSLSAAQLQQHADLIEKITSNYQLSVWGTAAADATAIAADSHVTEIAIEDSSDNIATALDQLQALGARLIDIEQTGTPATMNLLASQVIQDADALNAISGTYTIAVSDADAAYAMQLADLPTVETIAVKDSGANIAAALDDLLALGDKLAGVTLSDSTPVLQLSGEQYADHPAALAKLSGAEINVSDALLSQLTALAADTRVTSIGVSDSAAHISAGFNSLASLGDTLQSIAVSGDDTRLSLTSAQYAAGTDTLAKIANGYTLALAGMSAEDAVAAAADATVADISVNDTAANIAGNLSGLSSLGARLQSLQQTDTGALPVTVSEFSSASSLWSKFDGTLSLAVTDASASDVAHLAQHDYVDSVSVSDDSAGLGASWDALSENVNKLQSIAQSDADAISITAAQLQTGAALVAKLPAGYTLSVTAVGADDAQDIANRSDVSELAVADTADNIVNSLATLSTLDKLAAFTVTDGSTLELSAAQQSAYASLLAKLDAGITVDTASA